jgi:hypothetical protein
VRQLEPDHDFAVFGLAADEADWANDDVIIRVLIQTHGGTSTNFDLFVFGLFPVFSWDS